MLHKSYTQPQKLHVIKLTQTLARLQHVMWPQTSKHPISPLQSKTAFYENLRFRACVASHIELELKPGTCVRQTP